jgi:hypothetical protein
LSSRGWFDFARCFIEDSPHHSYSVIHAARV